MSMPFEDQHTMNARMWLPVEGSAAIDLGDVRPVDLLDAWTFAQATADLALKRWMSAPADEKGDAWTGYRAALDREEQAAAVLELALTGARDRERSAR